MLLRIIFYAFAVGMLGGCASTVMHMMFDFSRFDGSKKLHDRLEIRDVNSSFKEPTRLSIFVAALERVELKNNPGTETCAGFANWLPNEMVRVPATMDLRLVAFGQYGKGLVVTHPSGKIECGAFAVDDNPAEIILKNAVPGVYQVRISSPNINPRVGDFDNNAREPENENRLYRGDFMQIFAEDISDQNPAIFEVTELKNIHLRVREKGRLEANSSWDQAVERGRALLAQEAKERRELLSDVLSVSVQALQVVAEEQQKQAFALQAAQQQLAYSQAQQQELPTSPSNTRKAVQLPASQTPAPVRAGTASAQVGQATQQQQALANIKPDSKKNYPAIVLEFPNAEGWRRGDSSSANDAGDLTVAIEAKPAVTKGKMSVITSFCNNGETVWKGGVRVSTTPPTRSHASRQIPAGGCSSWEETFSEGASTIYVYTKRAE